MSRVELVGFSFLIFCSTEYVKFCGINFSYTSGSISEDNFIFFGAHETPLISFFAML